MSLPSCANILEVLYRSAVDSTISSIIVHQPVFVSLSISPSIHHDAILA